MRFFRFSQVCYYTIRVVVLALAQLAVLEDDECIVADF